MNCPLFWILKPEDQVKLMKYQWDNYGEKLDIPTPPGTSRGVCLAAETENIDEIDRLMRQAPSNSRGKDGN